MAISLWVATGHSVLYFASKLCIMMRFIKIHKLYALLYAHAEKNGNKRKNIEYKIEAASPNASTKTCTQPYMYHTHVWKYQRWKLEEMRRHSLLTFANKIFVNKKKKYHIVCTLQRKTFSLTCFSCCLLSMLTSKFSSSACESNRGETITSTWG